MVVLEKPERNQADSNSARVQHEAQLKLNINHEKS